MVSVAMITYNQEKLIEQAINSVLMQECNFNFELIVANDHSTDSTNLVIQKILSEHPKAKHIKYINRESNVGMSFNFIDTIKQGKGKYIALCEGDDYWTDPLKLQKQLDFLEINLEYSMICHNALIVNQIDNSSRLFYNSDEKSSFYSTVDTLNVHLCPTASIFFKKPPLDLFDQFPYATNSGDQMLIQLISLTGLIYRMDDVMSVYRIHPLSITQSGNIGIIQVLQNRKSDLQVFNKISEGKFKKNVWIEIFLINIRISFLKKPSKFNSKIFSISRKVMAVIKKI